LICEWLLLSGTAPVLIACSGMTGPSSRTTVVTRRQIRSSSGSGNVFGHGPQRGSLASCNLQRAHHVFLSMASRTSKVLMDQDVLLSRSRETRKDYLVATRASTDWIYRHIQTMRAWKRNYYLLSSKFFPVLYRHHHSDGADRETEGFGQE
jgi:hypothetical protein